MKKTILICGHGPGISDAVARKFGADGFAVALAARSADKLDAAVKALGAKGITAAAFPTDLGNPQAVKQLVSSVHAKLGPLNVLHWNVYASPPTRPSCRIRSMSPRRACGPRCKRRTATSKSRRARCWSPAAPVRLGKEGIYVGEVVVTGAVTGTVSDQGNATIEAGAVAEKFWALYQARSEHSTTI
jgi:NAD(P)-dependent dehydrogenase (short-subunit alcohol dehydrogenase family)